MSRTLAEVNTEIAEVLAARSNLLTSGQSYGLTTRRKQEVDYAALNARLDKLYLERDDIEASAAGRGRLYTARPR